MSLFLCACCANVLLTHDTDCGCVPRVVVCCEDRAQADSYVAELKRFRPPIQRESQRRLTPARHVPTPGIILPTAGHGITAVAIAVNSSGEISGPATGQTAPKRPAVFISITP